MFRTEDRFQRDPLGLGENINSSASLSVDSGLVGQQSDFLFSGGCANQLEIMSFEDIDSSLYRSIARNYSPGGSLRFVVASNALPPQFIFFTYRQWKRSRHGGGDLRAQRDCSSLPTRMNRIGQQDDIGVRDRINPHGCSGESSVTERSYWQQFPTIA